VVLIVSREMSKRWPICGLGSLVATRLTTLR
jgi:hypothetical protein